MEIPKQLEADETAIEFFLDHAERCEGEGTLTLATLPAFILLAKNYSMLINLEQVEGDKMYLIKWSALTGKFQSNSRLFNMSSDKAQKKTIAKVAKHKAFEDEEGE